MSGAESILIPKYFAFFTSETIFKCKLVARMSINPLHIVDDTYDTFFFPVFLKIFICSPRKVSKLETSSRQPK